MKTVFFTPIKKISNIFLKSGLQLGGTYIGELEESKFGNKVYYTDASGAQWLFYVGDTCKLVDQLPEKPAIAKTVERATEVLQALNNTHTIAVQDTDISSCKIMNPKLKTARCGSYKQMLAFDVSGKVTHMIPVCAVCGSDQNSFSHILDSAL